METVAEAARALDAEMPGWADRIDVERLDMTSNTSCILGQVFEHYSLAPDVFYDMENDASGFSVLLCNRFLPEWKDAIAERGRPEPDIW